MTYVLLILMGGSFAAGAVYPVGYYRTSESCEAARKVLISDETPLSKKYVVCTPIDGAVR